MPKRLPGPVLSADDMQPSMGDSRAEIALNVRYILRQLATQEPLSASSRAWLQWWTRVYLRMLDSDPSLNKLDAVATTADRDYWLALQDQLGQHRNPGAPRRRQNAAHAGVTVSVIENAVAKFRRDARAHIAVIEKEEGRAGLVAMGEELDKRLADGRTPKKPRKKRKASTK
jgi:hypothetical protein